MQLYQQEEQFWSLHQSTGTHLDHRMPDPGGLPEDQLGCCGGCSYAEVLTPAKQKHPQRKWTIFTEKQLADLRVPFNKNPHPTSSLEKEMASQMDIHPRVLQVWFKNHRAKLKKGRYKHIQQKQEAEQQQLAEAGVKTSSFKKNMDSPSRCLNSAYPASLVTDHPTPSFQPSICPNVKGPTDHSVGTILAVVKILTYTASIPSGNPRFFHKLQFWFFWLFISTKNLAKSQTQGPITQQWLVMTPIEGMFFNNTQEESKRCTQHACISGALSQRKQTTH